MSPEMISIITVGVALFAGMISFGGLGVALLLRMDRRIERTNERIDRTNERIDQVIGEVKAIAQNQALTDLLVKELAGQMKELASQMKELTLEVKTIAQNEIRVDLQVKGMTDQMKELTGEVQTIGHNQARMEGEIATLRDVILHRSPERD